MKKTNFILLLIVSGLVFSGLWTKAVEAEEQPASPISKLSLTRAENSAMDEKHRLRAAEMINRALEYLVSQREGDGGWSLNGAYKPAITAFFILVFNF